MDKPPGKHEKTNGGDDQKKPSKEPSVEADHQNPNSQKQHEGEAAEKPRDKKASGERSTFGLRPTKFKLGSVLRSGDLRRRSRHSDCSTLACHQGL